MRSRALALLLLAASPFACRSASAAAADSARVTAAPVAPAPSAGAPRQLADGSTERHLTLANGLRIVTRNLPGAKTAAITLGYRFGAHDDPDQHEGLAELAAQVEYTGRAGDVPERSLAELDQLRPTGWGLRVGPWTSLLTEACPTELLPAVLHQVAERLHGVIPGDTLVSRAREQVRRRLRQNYDIDPAKSLYFLSDEMATGQRSDRAERYGTGAGLDRITTHDVAAVLQQRFVPANCVLSVTGDLAGIDIAALVGRSTGSIAPGTASPAPVWGRTRPSTATLVRPDISRPIGVLGVLAPALSDTMHPYFTAFSASAASILGTRWGKPDPPLTTRFQYNIANDPEIVRFYPPCTDSVSMEELFGSHLDDMELAIADSSSIRSAVTSIAWVAGGPMTPELFKRSLADPSVVLSLSQTLASLELYADESFWAAYRARLERARQLDLGTFFRAYVAPNRRVVLLLRPRP